MLANDNVADEQLNVTVPEPYTFETEPYATVPPPSPLLEMPEAGEEMVQTDVCITCEVDVAVSSDVSNKPDAGSTPALTDLSGSSTPKSDVDVHPDSIKGAWYGMCGFPGCLLPDRHAGLHQTPEPCGKRRRIGAQRDVSATDGDNQRRDLAPRRSSPSATAPRRLLYRSLETIPELRFSETAPYGVSWPPDAAARFKNSLCCVRGLALQSVSLDALREELIGQSKVLPWGSAKSSVQSRSRKKLIWLNLQRGSRAQAEGFMLQGPNAAPRSKLAEELDASGNAIDTLCHTALAEELRAAFKVAEPPLAFQPNFAHSDFPMHYDCPGSDGFGTRRRGFERALLRRMAPAMCKAQTPPALRRSPSSARVTCCPRPMLGVCAGRTVLTLNVKEGATILVEESLDQPGCRWKFALAPGDAWAMRGYARERCAHGVSVGYALTTPCEAGCRECRVSLNLRCGAHTADEAERIEAEWRRAPPGVAAMMTVPH